MARSGARRSEVAQTVFSASVAASKQFESASAASAVGGGAVLPVPVGCA
jgi:hypothetical protein